MKPYRTALWLLAVTFAMMLGHTLAHAAEPPTSCFEIQSVKWWAASPGYIRIATQVKNNCNLSAGVELRAVISDSNGDLIKTPAYWPASINNIPPGQVYPFVYLESVDRPVAKIDVTVNRFKQW